MDDESQPAVGFDFGTSTTLIARGQQLVPIGTSTDSMPSLIGYADDGSIVVGEHALSAVPGQTIRSIKRAITQRRSVVRVQAPSGTRDASADELISALLRAAARRAIGSGLDLFDRGPTYFGCPAMWDGPQRRRLLSAAQRAGLPATMANLVDEPIAAALAWLSARPGHADPLRILVFDMGGGTLDVGVVDVRAGDEHVVRLRASLGVSEAGDTLDEAIADDLAHALGIADGAADDVRRELLVDAARRAKLRLTVDHEVPVVLPPALFSPNEVWYTREQLDTAFAPQLDQAEDLVLAALQAASLTGTQLSASTEALLLSVDIVLLAGGMSHVPAVGQLLRELFPVSTSIEAATNPPEIAVAVGLAAAATYQRINLYNLPFDIAIEWDEGRESRTLYEAYGAIVEPWQLARHAPSNLFWRSTGQQLSLPEDGKGRVRIVSYGADPSTARLSGESLDGYAVELNGARFEFTVYPGGRLHMVDGAGVHEGHAVS